MTQFETIFRYAWEEQRLYDKYCSASTPRQGFDNFCKRIWKRQFQHKNERLPVGKSVSLRSQGSICCETCETTAGVHHNCNHMDSDETRRWFDSITLKKLEIESNLCLVEIRALYLKPKKQSHKKE